MTLSMKSGIASSRVKKNSKQGACDASLRVRSPAQLRPALLTAPVLACMLSYA